MSYVQSLLQYRELADKIRSGEYQASAKQSVKESSQGLVRRPDSKQESASPRESSVSELEEMTATYLAGLRRQKEPTEPTSKPRTTEGGTPRPYSRGDTAKNVGRRLLSDLMSDFNLTREQAAGFVGNLDHETGGFKFMQEIEPMIPGSRGGFGFAQWTGPRRKEFEAWSAENKLDPASYEANYGFLKYELENTREGRVLDSLRKSSSVQDAATVVSEKFLRPGKPNLTSRISRAARYLEEEV